MNFLYLLFVLIIRTTTAFDPFSIGSALAAIGGVTYKFLKSNTICSLKECCSEEEIPANYASKL